MSLANARVEIAAYVEDYHSDTPYTFLDSCNPAVFAAEMNKREPAS